MADKITSSTKTFFGWTIAGWATVLVASLAWCLVISGMGAPFENSRLETIPQGSTWTAGDVSLTVNTVIHGTTITVPDEDPVLATPGANFVFVLVDYDATSDGYSCLMTLVGKGREWQKSFAAAAATVMPGSVDNCSLTGEATIGALFEIPASALTEIQGVRLEVTNTDWEDDNLYSIFNHDIWRALLTVTIP